MCTRSSSISPAARYWLMVVAPPPIATSPSPTVARACASADSIPSVTKWYVVPPAIGCGSRAWWVSTKTGAWNGGSSPHQPFHGRSHAPRTGPQHVAPHDERGRRGHPVDLGPVLVGGLEHPRVQLAVAAVAAEGAFLGLFEPGRVPVGRDRDVADDPVHGALRFRGPCSRARARCV